MRYHTARGKLDITKVYDQLMKKISLMPLSPDMHPQANFGHLMGGYEAAGVMNPETGAKYRELILAPGRSYDKAGQVAKFLGRP